MSSFSGVDFKIRLQDGFSPLPEKGDDGVTRLRLDIAVFGTANYSALRAKQSRGTPKPVNGTDVTNWHSNNGIGSASLIVPWYRGATKTYTAVLTSLSLEGSLAYPDASEPLFRGTAEFVILSSTL